MGGGGYHKPSEFPIWELRDSAQKSRSLFCCRNQTGVRRRRNSSPIAGDEAIHRIAQESWNQRANRGQHSPDSTEIFRRVEHCARLYRSLAIGDPQHRFDGFQMELAAQVFPQLRVAGNEEKIVALLVPQDELHRPRAESAGAVVNQHRRIIGGKRHFRHCTHIDEPQRHGDTEKIRFKKYSVSLCLSGRCLALVTRAAQGVAELRQEVVHVVACCQRSHQSDAEDLARKRAEA